MTTDRSLTARLRPARLAYAFLLAFTAAPLSAIEITETTYEGRAQFQIKTANATWSLDKKGGGFSRLIDAEGRDWVNFKKEPLSQFPESAAAGFRGIGNLIFGEGKTDAGGGHPGFDQCSSVIAGETAIRVTSASGAYVWTWMFDDETARFHMEKAPADQPWWFLYEGPVAGRYAPKSQYWGTQKGGPRKDIPTISTQHYDDIDWVYFGDESSPRILFLVQKYQDKLPDNLWYLGSSHQGAADSADGMMVFGFGRGPKTQAQFRGAGQKFIIGLKQKKITTEAEHRELASDLDQQVEPAPLKMGFTEETLFGEMECVRVTTPSGIYVFGKKGAGLVSMIDLEGKDWLSYQPGKKAEGEYRGMPKCGQPTKFFHCGYSYGQYQTSAHFVTKTEVISPTLIRISSETTDGAAAGHWDITTDYARFTLTKIPENKFWFLYEGTPGGALDEKDTVIRPSGAITGILQPWKETVRWVGFDASESAYSLVCANHQKNSPVDSHVTWPYKPDAEGSKLHQMTVFGFGRPDWQDPAQHTPIAQPLPASYTVGFVRQGFESIAAMKWLSEKK
jgi:hypothetical protein